LLELLLANEESEILENHDDPPADLSFSSTTTSTSKSKTKENNNSGNYILSATMKLCDQFHF
jgi:hypothetical protein